MVAFGSIPASSSFWLASDTSDGEPSNNDIPSTVGMTKSCESASLENINDATEATAYCMNPATMTSFKKHAILANYTPIFSSNKYEEIYMNYDSKYLY